MTAMSSSAPSVAESAAVVRPMGSGPRVREVLAAAGARLGAGRVFGAAPPPVARPFQRADPLEATGIDGVRVGGPAQESVDAGFADGVQRFAVEGWVGVAPVVRGYVAAAVLHRHDRVLAPAAYRREEFIVAPLARLGGRIVDDLAGTGLPVYDADADRPHPLMDVQRAAQVVERRRERLEADVVREYRSRYPGVWLVVDGSLAGHTDGETAATGRYLVGVIKSHETQFLAGRDLETALTLPEGCRTGVFRRAGPGGVELYSWYLRLRDWAGRDLLYGLLRVERFPGDGVVGEVGEISRWLLAERAPVSAPDGRWDRLLYPIHMVEDFLRAKVEATCTSA